MGVSSAEMEAFPLLVVTISFINTIVHYERYIGMFGTSIQLPERHSGCCAWTVLEMPDSVGLI